MSAALGKPLHRINVTYLRIPQLQIVVIVELQKRLGWPGREIADLYSTVLATRCQKLGKAFDKRKSSTAQFIGDTVQLYIFGSQRQRLLWGRLRWLPVPSPPKRRIPL